MDELSGEIKKTKLEDLGYDDFFESNRKRLKLDSFAVARVIAEHKGAYDLVNEKGEFSGKITGKILRQAQGREDYPAVGDWVAISELDGACGELVESRQAVIHGILPRKTIIKRKYGDRNKTGDKTEVQVIGTNIDVAFVVESVDRDYSLNRFERYFAIAENGGVKPAVILNKIDLLFRKELREKLSQLKNRFPDIDIIFTSALGNEGLNELRKYIAKGKTHCFLGSSGVGKSSLINTLLGRKVIKTGDISSYSGRGKHVTTKRQMYFLEDGGIVIDNPGMREVGLTDASQGVEAIFDEISVLAQKCRYADCSHAHEPGCEVINAVKSGELDKDKYSNYINLKKEAEYFEMNDLEKREKDRQFGKFIKKAKKELKDLGHKDRGQHGSRRLTEPIRHLNS